MRAEAQDTLTALEAEIRAAGRQLERTFAGAVANAPGPDDPGWQVHVDGELVATGGSIGRVEAGLRRWWEDEDSGRRGRVGETHKS